MATTPYKAYKFGFVNVAVWKNPDGKMNITIKKQYKDPVTKAFRPTYIYWISETKELVKMLTEAIHLMESETNQGENVSKVDLDDVF